MIGSFLFSFILELHLFQFQRKYWTLAPTYCNDWTRANWYKTAIQWTQLVITNYLKCDARCHIKDISNDHRISNHSSAILFVLHEFKSMFFFLSISFIYSIRVQSHFDFINIYTRSGITTRCSSASPLIVLVLFFCLFWQTFDFISFTTILFSLFCHFFFGVFI